MHKGLLRLLPRDVRERHGAQIAATFADLSEAAGRHGRAAVGVLWMKETLGLVRFAVRERWRRLRAHLPDPRRGGPSVGAEFRWAWRGVRARGWRAGLIVGLLAIALGANAVVFSAADSFVFHRAPYRDADRLVVLQQYRRPIGWMEGISANAVVAWRKQRDLFSAFEAHAYHGSLYVQRASGPALVRRELVTPGLFAMLGVRPKWGRPFVASDEGEPLVLRRPSPGTPPPPVLRGVAIISADLARDLFGDPARAVGARLPSTDESPLIVGVMPAGFLFPEHDVRIWQPLDFALVDSTYDVDPLARAAADVSIARLREAVRSRAPAIVAADWPGGKVPPFQQGVTDAFPLPTLAMSDTSPLGFGDTQVSRRFILLVCAALCLLLVACANVASLELAGAIGRARGYAVRLALGGSRASLIRSSLMEGAMVIGASLAAGVALAGAGTTLLSAHLPAAMLAPLTNPIGLDGRVLAFAAAAAAATWLLASLPVLIFATRTDPVERLKADRGAPTISRTSRRVRQALIVAEVALSVLLLAGALLAVGTYASRLAMDKGFESADLAALTVRQPPNPSAPDAVVERDLLTRLRGAPFVRTVLRVDAVPPATDGWTNMPFHTAPGQPPFPMVGIGWFAVDPGFFGHFGFRLLSGRGPEIGDDRYHIVVDQGFAARYFPGVEAVGQQFYAGNGTNEVYTIVGVAAHVRTQFDTANGLRGPVFPGYQLADPNTPTLSYLVQLTDPARLADLTAVARSVAPGDVIRTDTVDNQYARLFADQWLLALVMSAFGALAFVVSVAGIYGVMAFLVAGRRQEIGIRMALGADRRDVQRLVLGSSLRLVGAGLAVGTAATLAASHWAASLLYGVTASDPRVYLAVGATMGAAALVATWQPARRAARVDPAVTLRAE